jgi:hypothetical protein
MSIQPDPRDTVERFLHTRPRSVTIHDRVNDFFAINRGDIVILGGRQYLISGTAKEKAFGLDDEPKHWVKYAFDVSTGKRKIIKLVFSESVDMKFGDSIIKCFRSPSKEGLALKSVEGHLNFMQGHTVAADEDEEIRVIDHISGKTLLDKIVEFRGSHEAYFHRVFPPLVRLFLPCLDALDHIHRLGIRHGDVRSDHLILDKDTGQLRWIDFDYDFIFDEAPTTLDLLGVGNVLSELVGKGEQSIHRLRSDNDLKNKIETLRRSDFSVVQSGRLMHWRKLYPYIPEKLNRVLMHFTAEAELFYESAAEIAEDLREALGSIPVENDLTT